MSETIPQREFVPPKSEWGAGPWQDEPDRVDFVAHGFSCMLRRQHHGVWCGYVGVPREHPLYGKDWRDTHEIGELSAHRGINYSDLCDDGEICHVPQPGMPADVWWLGFDCGHAFDFQPALEARLRGCIEGAEERGLRFLADALRGPKPIEIPDFMREVYRALPYVRGEVERLAAQLEAIRASAALPCPESAQ